MSLQEVKQQAFKLSVRERWELIQALLESLKQETHPKPKRGNLSRLRGIAKASVATGEESIQKDYVTYLTEKYQ